MIAKSHKLVTQLGRGVLVGTGCAVVGFGITVVLGRFLGLHVGEAIPDVIKSWAVVGLLVGACIATSPRV